MFQFTGLATHAYVFSNESIQESRDRRLFDNFPWLFAVFHALLRLLTPRHPPCALNNLTTYIQRSLQVVKNAAMVNSLTIFVVDANLPPLTTTRCCRG